MSAISELNRFSNNILKIYRNNPDAIKIIFEYNLLNKVNISITDSNGNNLLHHIAENNDNTLLANVLNYINYYNKNNLQMINAQNNQGDTPMHIATRNKNDFGAKLLHSAGAILNIKNNVGEIIEDSDVNNTELELMNSSKPNKIIPVFTGTSKDSDESEQLLESLRKIVKKDILTKNKGYISFSMMGGNNDDDDDDFSDFQIKLVNINNMNGGSVESDKLHEEVIDFFKKMTNNEDDARALKAALYAVVKEKFPDKNGLERAKQMVDYTKDDKIIKEIKNKLDEYREIIRNARIAKENRNNSNSNSEEKEVMKEKKDKKEKKEKKDKKKK